jgi:hypothetical protein
VFTSVFNYWNVQKSYFWFQEVFPLSTITETDNCRDRTIWNRTRHLKSFVNISRLIKVDYFCKLFGYCLLKQTKKAIFEIKRSSLVNRKIKKAFQLVGLKERFLKVLFATILIGNVSRRKKFKLSPNIKGNKQEKFLFLWY